MKYIHSTIYKICFFICICCVATPCFAQTAAPIFLGLPFFFQSALFVDTGYQIIALFNEMTLNIWTELLVSFVVGLIILVIIIWIEYRSISKAFNLKKDTNLLRAIGIGNIVSIMASIPVSALFLTRSEIEFQSFGPIAFFPPTNSFWLVFGVYTPLSFAIGLIIMYLIKKSFIMHAITTDNPEAVKKAIWFANIKGYAYPLLTLLVIFIIGSVVLQL